MYIKGRTTSSGWIHGSAPWCEQQKRLREHREEQMKLKHARIKILQDKVSKLSDLRIKYLEHMKNHVNLQTLDLAQRINQYETDIKKLETALKICKSAMRSHVSEAVKNYKTKNPFEYEKELKRLREQLYRIT